MRTIYKYKLTITDKQVIDMPLTGLLHSIQFQGDELYAWVEVDTEYLKGKRTFWIVGTGHPLPKVEGHLMFRQTIQTPPFVWHIYEEQGAKEPK